MPAVTEGRQWRSKAEPRALIFAAVTLLLLVGVGLLPLTGRTVSFGSRGWVSFRVDAGAGPGRGVEFTHVSNAYHVPGATFLEFRAGSWYWAACIANEAARPSR
jgi:hypothetical protein